MVSYWVLLGGETIHPDMLSCVYCPRGGGERGMSQIPGKYIPVTRVQRRRVLFAAAAAAL